MYEIHAMLTKYAGGCLCEFGNEFVRWTLRWISNPYGSHAADTIIVFAPWSRRFWQNCLTSITYEKGSILEHPRKRRSHKGKCRFVAKLHNHGWFSPQTKYFHLGCGTRTYASIEPSTPVLGRNYLSKAFDMSKNTLNFTFWWFQKKTFWQLKCV